MNALEAFLARYPVALPRWPDPMPAPDHTHGGNRFLTFEGTTVEFCTACALGLPPDQKPARLDRNSQEGVDTFRRTEDDDARP